MAPWQNTSACFLTTSHRWASMYSSCQKTTATWSPAALLRQRKLNQFSHFDMDSVVMTINLAPATSDQAFIIQFTEVIDTLCRVNTWKTAGPDGVPEKVLRDSTAELNDVFSDICNLYHVSTCLKTSAVVPISKQTAITSLNNYRPVALTPAIMKCLKRLVLPHIKTAAPILDPHQYAYRANRSTDNTISMTFIL